MRPALVVVVVGLLAALSGCNRVTADAGDGDGSVPTGPCADLDQDGCLARSDCHAGFEVSQCRNILGYCAEFRTCDDGQATCLGQANCDIPTPFCAGPFVNTYTQTCYGLCARADQCAGCQDAKMTFTQNDGCANDGSVEFCATPDLTHALQAIAPTVTCAPGGGRAGCDPATQLLCQFPTSGTACLAPHGALTDAAWDTLCGITMLPGVVEIVPTIFE